MRITLDEVDRQLENIGTPVSNTLAHVDEVTKSLEETAGTLSRTADLTRARLRPRSSTSARRWAASPPVYVAWLRERVND